MAWSRNQLFIAFLMVITGSINTLSTKWTDRLESKSIDGKIRPFVHPFFQACCMFFGEILCLILFKILYTCYSRRNDGSEDTNALTKGNRNFNPFILFIPAMCDMMATSLMYIGLNLTYASSFQMLRGSVIIFVGLLSVAFLQRVLKKQEWTGIFLVIIGLTVVGIADFVNKDTNEDNHGKNDIITGDLLIIIAQIITACQMVIEEKFVSGLDLPPLQAVGWEGIFGFVVLSLLQIVFYYIPVGPPFSNNAREVLEDVPDALVQISNNLLLLLAICGTVLSIAFFNFAGITVTKESSATTRMVLDSVRTIVIWAFSMILLTQKFHWLQLLGFVALITGMCLYNNITCRGIFMRIRSMVTGMRHRRLSEEVIVNQNADEATDVQP